MRKFKTTQSSILPLLMFFLISCSGGSIKIKEKKISYEVDSVDYHPIGKDNTLQVSPYWRIRPKGTTYFITSTRPYSVGDTIVVTERYITR